MTDADNLRSEFTNECTTIFPTKKHAILEEKKDGRAAGSIGRNEVEGCEGAVWFVGC